MPEIEPSRTGDRSEALAAASIPVLLMCLAQITRDPRWLASPYRPRRDISIFAEPSGGLSEHAQQDVREAMQQVLAELDRGERVLPALPSEGEMVTLMSTCLGEEVPPEYAPMAMEEMGFADRAVQRGVPAPAHAPLSVVVIGAGFSGLCATHRLKAMGLPFTVLEKNEDLGGAWLENTYPEAGVDTPNHFYSFSFAPNTAWSSNYSKRDEVWAYQKQVARELGLAAHIEFGVEVSSLHWHEDRGQWQVRARGRDGAPREWWAAIVITAAGQLNRPRLGAIPGLDTFSGRSWHSARWPADAALAGRRVAVVGTGASAMQFLRSVAAEARQVTVFQRSPQWARPPQDYHGHVSPATRWLLQHVPYYYAWYRFGLMWRFGDGLLPTVRRDPAWPHQQRSVNHRNEAQRRQLTEYLEQQLDGRPDLLAKCLPDYPPYGKRILIDNGWYAALRRDNVELVTAGVDHVEGGVLVDTEGRRHEADVIIHATGFEAGKMLWPIDIRGREGAELHEVWRDDDPKAYLGITVPRFPNLFVLTGPNTGLAHGGSMIFVAECQVRYVCELIREMQDRGLRELEVKAPVHDAYNARVDAEHAQLVWTHPGMRNWYRNDKGRVFGPMPWRLVDYWQMTRHARMADYDSA